MKLWYFPLGFFVCCYLISCIPYQEDVPTDVEYGFDDPTVRQIIHYQDRLSADSLLEYLSHPNPTYRYYAARAAASVKDPSILDSLSSLLLDPLPEVGAMAAYALGQLKNAGAEIDLINGFRKDDTQRAFESLNRHILEAIGKCGTSGQLNNLATISTYNAKDTMLLLGQAMGIYRFGLRGITSPDATTCMVNMIEDMSMPTEVRLVAANYLFRAKGLRLDSFIHTLDLMVLREKDPRIRMCLATAVGKTKSLEGLTTLFALYDKEQDYRVKCNIIRAFENYPYQRVRNYIFRALDDEIHVANVAVNYLYHHGNVPDAYFYLLKGQQDTVHWTKSIGLYEATIHNLPLFYVNSKSTISNELIDRFRRSGNNYEKAAILKALGEFGTNYTYVKEQGFGSIVPAIRTAAMESLSKILRHPEFDRFFRSRAPEVRKEIHGFVRDAIQSQDVSMIAIAGDLIADPKLKFKESFEDFDFIKNAKSNLTIPREYEAAESLRKAIDFLEGRGQSPVEAIPYNNPIDWNIVQEVSDSTRAIIKTNRGEITIAFFPGEAPGSVANFISLAARNYYDGKTFHRVVPNFVVQVGCNRGDGWGLMDYSIRSETPPISYNKGGFVGMASAGPHTESSQWFITHSPALHLDGNYSIFARVIDGMEVVHKIQVGDIINEITLVN